MYYKCCVPGCTSSRQDAILHKFPPNEKMLKKWLELIPCDLLQKKSVVILSTCKYVTYILNLVLLREKSHILKIGYTTLFLESEISTGIPLNRSEGIQNVNALDDHQHVMKRHYDHTYFKTEVLESYPHMMPINTDNTYSFLQENSFDQPLSAAKA